MSSSSHEGELVAAQARSEPAHPEEVGHVLVKGVPVIGAQGPQFEALADKQKVENGRKLGRGWRDHAGRDVQLYHQQPHRPESFRGGGVVGEVLDCSPLTPLAIDGQHADRRRAAIRTPLRPHGGAAAI